MNMLTKIPEQSGLTFTAEESNTPAKLIITPGEQSGAIVTSDTSNSPKPDVNGFVVTKI